MRPTPLLLLLLAAAPAAAQTSFETTLPAGTVAPSSPQLDIAREWGRHSSLGDLATTDIGTGDIELRYWGGFGATGTTGIVLRRSAGIWTGWRVDVVPCELELDVSVIDTLSAKTREAYAAEARSKCPPADGVGTFISADTLALEPLKARLIPLAWEGVVDAGAPILPPAIPRRWAVDDGYTHVIELRIGKGYRASVIECAVRPETADDYRVQKVAGALARLFPEVRIGCTR